MENKSEFLKLLERATYDDVALIKVIEKIMNKINYFSSNSHKEIDEDLKSVLILKTIEIVRKDEIYKDVFKKMQKKF